PYPHAARHSPAPHAPPAAPAGTSILKSMTMKCPASTSTRAPPGSLSTPSRKGAGILLPRGSLPPPVINKNRERKRSRYGLEMKENQTMSYDPIKVYGSEKHNRALGREWP